jgi:hypothetical protein
VEHTVRWAPRDLWEQVAHVDPVIGNPTVSEFTRREARRHNQKRADGKRVFDACLGGFVCESICRNRTHGVCAHLTIPQTPLTKVLLPASI